MFVSNSIIVLALLNFRQTKISPSKNFAEQKFRQAKISPNKIFAKQKFRQIKI